MILQPESTVTLDLAQRTNTNGDRKTDNHAATMETKWIFT